MPLQHLFTKREQRIVSGGSKEELVQRAAGYWANRGYRLEFRGPFLFHAEHFESHIGLRKVVDLSVSDYNKDSAVDLSLSATLGDTGAIVGGIGLLVLPVAAIVVGGVSYLDYDQSANVEIADFWRAMLAMPIASGAAQQPIKRCPSCGTLNEPDSSFCRKCGTKLGSFQG
ncbi:MAG TPA: zinc-ribbon domain-containing protein [Methanomassiliicoccales archaeon]|nr:zinc-ribbon domain-containing protein [Methanomassiliicoccales archaeon]